MEEPSENAAATDAEKANLVVRQIDRWIASMERLRLADYVRYVTTASACSGPAFSAAWRAGWAWRWAFTILGAILVIILQDLARHNLPLIGDMLAQIVSVVQKQLE